jgi:hypothetical protein
MQSTLLSGTSIIINGVIMLTSIAYFDPTIIIKLKKKLKRSITDIIDRVLHFMYMQRKEFMKEMDMLLIYICLFY